MGDAGSLFLGLTLAALTLTAGGPTHDRSRILSIVVAPMLVLLIPIFDATLVTIFRLVAGRPVSKAAAIIRRTGLWPLDFPNGEPSRSFGRCGDRRCDWLCCSPHIRCRRLASECRVRDRDGRVCGVSRTGARL